MSASEQSMTEPDVPRLLSIVRGGQDATGFDEPASEAENPGSDPTADVPDNHHEAPDHGGARGEGDGVIHHDVVDRGDAAAGDQAAMRDDSGIRGGSDDHGAGRSGTDADDSSRSDDAEAAEAIVDQARALLEDADPLVYYRSLRGLVRDSHSSVLGPLDYSGDLPYHDPSQVVVDPAPVNVETALLYARAAYPEFDEVILASFTDPARADLLTALYHLLFVEGRNVAVVTNHGQIIDIALVMAALFAAMLADGRSFGVLGDKLTVEDLAEHSNTLVSRMVVTRQAFGLPAVQVVQTISRIFLSLPQTQSRRRAKIEPTLVKANNALMRHELDLRLAQGGQILAMAASGTQDLTIPRLMNRARLAWRSRRGDDPGEEPTMHLQPLYNGTISLMRSCDYVLPVAVSLDARCAAVSVGSLTKLAEDEDCHRIMDWIALAHQEVTGVPTIYHRPGDDLLTHVRSLINR